MTMSVIKGSPRGISDGLRAYVGREAKSKSRRPAKSSSAAASAAGVLRDAPGFAAALLRMTFFFDGIYKSPSS
jgi:hypothetical protein